MSIKLELSGCGSRRDNAELEMLIHAEDAYRALDEILSVLGRASYKSRCPDEFLRYIRRSYMSPARKKRLLKLPGDEVFDKLRPDEVAQFFQQYIAEEVLREYGINLVTLEKFDDANNNDEGA